MTNRHLLLFASLLLVAACSTTPKEGTPAKVEANAPAPVPATVAPSTGNPSPAVANPLKDPGNILSRRSVYFDYDESSIKDSDRALLEAHAKYLRQHPDARVTVQGNTDERGSREYNVALGQRRADSVKRLMTVLGAPDHAIDTVSFGKEKPRCTLSEESCWSQNRRADLVYVGD